MSTQMTTQYLVSDMDFVAFHFPKYEFKQLIKEGMTGAVFKVNQVDTERDVAFRVIARRLGKEKSIRTALRGCAQAAVKLDHPNIVKMHETGEVEGMFYMAQEFISGSTLDAAAGGVKVDIGQVIEITEKLCKAVAHAHEKGVLHGDLQPKSVFITPDIDVKIADFGLAMTMRVNGKSELARFNPAFTSPEVLTGKTTGDIHSDIYSVGAICYYLLTANSITSPNAKRPSEVRRCDQRFDQIVAKAISTDPAKSYQSMYEMLADIRALSQTKNEPESIATARERYTTSIVRTPKFNFPKAG